MFFICNETLIQQQADDITQQETLIQQQAGELDECCKYMYI
jgi:hypothetical protein